jgi:hypothetical protein
LEEFEKMAEDEDSSVAINVQIFVPELGVQVSG